MSVVSVSISFNDERFANTGRNLSNSDMADLIRTMFTEGVLRPDSFISELLVTVSEIALPLVA